MEQSITIESNWWQGESQTNLIHLRDIEFKILFKMYQSKELFKKITDQIKTDDFTFAVNKKIYEYLLFYAKEDTFFDDESKKTEIALNISDIYNINPITTLKILDGRTKHHECIFDFGDDQQEENLDLDIFELLDFSKNRHEIIAQNNDDEKAYSNIHIEDEYGFYGTTYSNGIIFEIGTTYIFHLPDELCDTFKYTFENIMPYIQTDNYDVTMQINEEDPEDIQAFCLKKNIDKIEQVEKVIQWAKKNNIDYTNLPRNRGSIWEYSITEEFDECDIEDIPKELFTVKKNSFSFNFMNNKIKSIPTGISSSKCNTLMLCNNEIEEFPKSVYELKELGTICLHGNKIKSIPDDIDILKELKHLTISNNPIKKLPSTVSNIIALKELDIENTFIDEDSLDYLDLEQIEKISFDDRLLPYFIGNIKHLINIDTINLIHSEYSKEDELIKSLNLQYDNETWMEDKDYQGHGCIVLSKKESE